MNSSFYNKFNLLHERFTQKWYAHNGHYKAANLNQLPVSSTTTINSVSKPPEATETILQPTQTIASITPPSVPYLPEVTDATDITIVDVALTAPTSPIPEITDTSDIIVIADTTTTSPAAPIPPASSVPEVTDTPVTNVVATDPTPAEPSPIVEPELALQPQPNNIFSIVNAISLSDSEIAALRTLAATDSDANDWMTELKKVAYNALDDTINPPVDLVSSGEASRTGATANTAQTAKESDKVFRIALWYRISGDITYLNKTRDYLTTWATINQPSSDPVENTTLVDMFKAYDLVKESLSTDDRSKIESWMKGIADKSLESYNLAVASGSQTSYNNHQSHRIRAVAAIGLILGNDTYINFAADGFKRQIDLDLNPDGTSYDYIRRDAMHYHCYNLEALLDTAIMLDRADALKDENGVAINPFTYEVDGASLEKSVAFTIPFATGDETHIDYVNSQEKVDAARGLLAVPFDPKDALDTISLTSYFTDTLNETNLVQLADTLKGTSLDEKYPTLEILLNAVS